MDLFIYWEYSDRIFLYTEISWNKICTYTENTWNARKFEYLIEIETKIKNTLRHLPGAQMGWFGWTTLNNKKLMQVDL